MDRRTFLTGLGATACTSTTPAARPASTDASSEPTDTANPPSTATTATTGDTGATLDKPARFQLPPESDPHAGCIIQFPPPTNYCRPGQSTCSFYDEARRAWIDTILAVSAFEPVVVYATEDQEPSLRAVLPSEVAIEVAPLSDGWSRDSAPLFLTDGEGRYRAEGFAFNGWGEAVEFADDALVKPRMAADLAVPLVPRDMVLEGGAILIDGDRLVTTQSCLLNPNRNPDLDQAAQEALLSEAFGVSRFVWLRQGWTPDPITNGHIDGFCAIVAPGIWLVNSLPPGSQDPNAAILLAAKEALEAEGITVIDLPATSYTAFHINFYLCNGGLVVPIEGSPRDDVPLGILRDLFPKRTVVGVNATALGRSGGGIHCITQQVPAGVPWPW